MKMLLQKRTWAKHIIFLCLVMAIFICCNTAAKAEEQRIQCGDNAYATLSSTGVLTISGTGDMWNCADGKSYFNDIMDNIYKVVIQDGITSIGNYVFTYRFGGNLLGARALQSVTIGKGVRHIGDYAFACTSGLFSIQIPGNVQTIGKSAFYKSALKSCTLNRGLQVIEPSAFTLTDLTSIVIPDGITAIREEAFSISELKNVTIPENIGVIENRAFPSVSATIYSNNVTIVAGAFGYHTVFTAKRNSTADQYAKNYGKQITYFECVPNSGYPQLNHSWDAGVYTAKPTCTSKGILTYTCSRCGATKSESINTTTHIYGAWQTTTAATVLKQGVMTRSCTGCGLQETKKIARLTSVLSLNVNSLKLQKGQSTNCIKVTEMGYGDSVSAWTSSNTRVVKVNSKGKITAKQAGKAYITVTLKSGIKKSVKVVVKNTRVTTTKLTVTCQKAVLQKRRVTLKKGKKCVLIANVRPLTSTERVQYTSSNKKVATVTKNGTVTARKKGIAKITVKSGRKRVVIKVQVR